MTIWGVNPDFRHTQTQIQSSRVLQSPSEFSSAVAVETRGSCSTIQWQCTALNGNGAVYGRAEACNGALVVIKPKNLW